MSAARHLNTMSAFAGRYREIARIQKADIDIVEWRNDCVRNISMYYIAVDIYEMCQTRHLRTLNMRVNTRTWQTAIQSMWNERTNDILSAFDSNIYLFQSICLCALVVRDGFTVGGLWGGCAHSIISL